MPASPSRRPRSRSRTPDSDDTMDVQIDDTSTSLTTSPASSSLMSLLLSAPSPSRPPPPFSPPSNSSAESRKRSRNYPPGDIEMMTMEQQHSPKRARLGTRNGNNNNSIESAMGLAVVSEESSSASSSSLLLQDLGVGGVASLSSLSSSSLMSPPSSSIPLDASSARDTNLPPSLSSSRPQSFQMSRSNSSVKMSSRTGSRSNSEAGTPAPGGKSSSSTPQHSFWFEDGDILLGVQDVYFRVHSAKLADCSSAFRTLRDNGWRLPGASASSYGPDKLDGRPMVRLEGDAPKDWIVVLEAIYEAPQFYLRPVVFDSLGSLLRISTKYDICGIRGWVIAQLRATWPDPQQLHRMGPMAIPRAAEAISWGRAYDVPCILPAAFYALSVHRWRSNADGGRAHTVLTPMDMRALIQGRESLQDVLVEWIAEPLVVQPPPAPPKTFMSSSLSFTRDHHHPSTSTPRLDSIDTIKAVSLMQVTVVQEPPKPAEIPRFSFHHLHQAGGAEGCGPRLAKLWRRRLRPDARRPWGTWLLRELHRMASLPMGTASCRASPESSAVDKSSTIKVDKLSIIPDALLPIGRASPVSSLVATAASSSSASSSSSSSSSSSRPGPPRPPGEKHDAEMDPAPDGPAPTAAVVGVAQGLGFGSEDLEEAEDGRLVCAQCWEEHRRLVLWRMNWLKGEIPGMFGLHV